MFSLATWVTLFQRAVMQGVPILFGATGEILTEKSGNLNLGIPGIMYVGGISGVIGSFLYEQHVTELNPFLAVLIPLICTLFGSLLMGLLYCFLTVTLRANQTVVGAAINVLGSGLSATLYRIIFGVATNNAPIDTFDVLAIPLVKDIPILGEAFFQQKPIVYIAFLMVPLVSYYLFRTQSGLNLRSVGENPKVADTLGIIVKPEETTVEEMGLMMGGMPLEEIRQQA